MELAKVWNSQMTWNPMLGEKDHKFISRDEDGISSVDEKSEILTIKDEGRVQKVVVKHEPRTCQFFSIQDGECDHTKWLDIQKMKEDEYLTLRPERRVRWDADCLIEHSQVSTTLPTYMVDGLKLHVR